MVNIIGDLFFVITVVFCVVTKAHIIKNKENKEILEDNIVTKFGNYILIVIFAFSVFILTFRLSSVPEGLHVDEAGSLYDAICISKYGVDRFLYKLPVYFVNFGGGQNALYTYLAALMVKIFGVSTFVFRLPAVILSLISIVLLYKVVLENNGKKEALITTFILAICPWFIMKSRWGLESYLMCSLLMISMYFFVKALNFNKTYMYFISGLFFGITLYTYAIAYIVVPAIVGILVLYMLINKKIKIKNIIVMAIPMGILAVPLLLMLMYNSGLINEVNIPIFSIPKLWFYRGGEISIKNIPENLKNIFDVLFIEDFLNYNAISKFGTLYKLSIPLVIFGFIEVLGKSIKDVKNKEFTLDLAMLVNFCVVFIIGLCLAELNINKINAIYIPMVYFAGRFLGYISDNIKYAIWIVLALYVLNAGLFCRDYFVNYANSDLAYFESDIISAVKKAEELNRKQIRVEDCLNQTYIYTLIANPISPYEFNENVEIDYENRRILEYGKYVFKIAGDADRDDVYIIKNDEERINLYKEVGFKSEQYGDFSVLWFDRD